MNDNTEALVKFDAALDDALCPDGVYRALYELTQDMIGVRLFTVMETDVDKGEGCRVWSNQPDVYPTSGRKVLPRNHWFEVVIDRQEPFIANTIEEIDAVFPDADLIAQLGCGSVVNLPVVDGPRAIGSVNLLDHTGSFTPGRVAAIRNLLTVPAKRAMIRAAEMAEANLDCAPPHAGQGQAKS